MPGSTPSSSARRTGGGRPWRTVLVAGLASTLLVACGGGGNSASGSDSASSSSGGVQEVTFLNILPLASLTFTPDLVADSCGYFEKHGLKVNFETTQGIAPRHPDGPRRQGAAHADRRPRGDAGQRRQERRPAGRRDGQQDDHHPLRLGQE